MTVAPSSRTESADPGSGHGHGAAGVEPVVGGDAAVHDEVICVQGGLLVLPVAQPRPAQPQGAVQVRAGERHRPGRRDPGESQVAVDLEVLPVESREAAAVQGQRAEAGFGEHDRLVEHAVAEDDRVLDPGVAQVQRAGDPGAAQGEPGVMPRPGLGAQDFGDPLGPHDRPPGTDPPVAGTVPVRAQIYLLPGSEGAPQLLLGPPPSLHLHPLLGSAGRGLPP